MNTHIKCGDTLWGTHTVKSNSSTKYKNKKLQNSKDIRKSEHIKAKDEQIHKTSSRTTLFQGGAEAASFYKHNKLLQLI